LYWNREWSIPFSELKIFSVDLEKIQKKEDHYTQNDQKKERENDKKKRDDLKKNWGYWRMRDSFVVLETVKIASEYRIILP